MSLAIGVVQKDFIIASSDSAITIFPDGGMGNDKVDKKTDEFTEGNMIKTGIKSEKVYKLTNKVLFSACGNLYLTELIRIEIEQRIEEDYDLEKCRKVAKEVLNSVSNGIILHKRLFIKSMKENYFMSDFQLIWMRINFVEYITELLLKAEKANNLIAGYSAYLLGFNDDGTTGLVNISDGSYSSGPVDIRKGYPAIINGPKWDEYMQHLNLPIEQRRPEGFIARIPYIHAAISKEFNVNVSSDCNFHVLMKNGDGIDYEKFTVDTSEIQKELYSSNETG